MSFWTSCQELILQELHAQIYQFCKSMFKGFPQIKRIISFWTSWETLGFYELDFEGFHAESRIFVGTFLKTWGMFK